MTYRRSHLLMELFQYRPRARRTPLEDFLTAAFVGFLRTLPISKQIELATDLFIAPHNRTTFWHLCKKASNFRWDTQLTLPNGKRPDIVFWADGRPAIVVENKIWSSIAAHERLQSSDDDCEGADAKDALEDRISPDEINQLTTYGTWLRNARKPSSWPGSLVLLTHGTPPPADFCAENHRVYAAIPHTCRWSGVHNWIVQYLRSEQAKSEQDSASVFLGSDLSTFLEAKGFKMRPLNFTDIDVIGKNFALQKSIDTAFSETLASLRSSYPNLIAPASARAIKYEKAASIVWGYVYLKGEGIPRSAYFAWGIRFPAISSWWEDLRNQLPDENHAFCCLSSDHRTFSANKIPETDRPSGWLISSEGKDLFGFATLSALPSAQTLQQALTLWTIAKFEEIKPAISYISSGMANN